MFSCIHAEEGASFEVFSSYNNTRVLKVGLPTGMDTFKLGELWLDIALSYGGTGGYYLECIRLRDERGDTYVREDVEVDCFISHEHVFRLVVFLTSPDTNRRASVAMRLYHDNTRNVDVIAYSAQAGADVGTLHVAYQEGTAGVAKVLTE